MPVRPIRISDLKRPPGWPAPVPPGVPGTPASRAKGAPLRDIVSALWNKAALRARAVPPPLPSVSARPMLNRKALALAGGAALLLVAGVVAWAVSHPADRPLSFPAGTLSDRAPSPDAALLAVGGDPGADAAPVCDTLGTSVEFDPNLKRAATRAAKAQKLLMVLHVSGNFEESGFTWNNAEALRVNALANPEVGNYINAAFVSTYQKVGTFTLAGGQKQGGNVATYFCTADFRVLHAVAGPVNAATLLREARWAVETYKLALLDRPDESSPQFRSLVCHAHADRLREEYGIVLNDRHDRRRRGLGNQGQVHLLLAADPAPRLGQVYRQVFEDILGEKVSTAPVVVR